MVDVDTSGEDRQGGSGDVMPMRRLESVEERQAAVEESIRGMQNEYLLLQQALMKVDAQREIVEETQKRHDDEIRELKVMASEMKQQGDRLNIQYNSIYTTILQVLQQTQQIGSKERQSTLREMLKFLTWVISAVLGAYAISNLPL